MIQRDTMTVKEFEDLDSDLTAVVQTIAELSRCKRTVGGVCGNVSGDLSHLADDRTKEEMIVCDLVNPAEAGANF